MSVRHGTRHAEARERGSGVAGVERERRCACARTPATGRPVAIRAHLHVGIADLEAAEPPGRCSAPADVGRGKLEPTVLGRPELEVLDRDIESRIRAGRRLQHADHVVLLARRYHQLRQSRVDLAEAGAAGRSGDPGRQPIKPTTSSETTLASYPPVAVRDAPSVTLRNERRPMTRSGVRSAT